MRRGGAGIVASRPLAALLLSLVVLAWLGFAPTTGVAQAPKPTQEPIATLMRRTQDPLEDLLAFYIQNNFNFRTGGAERLRMVINLQPVLPFSLGPRLHLINRWNIPMVNHPIGTAVRAFGVGDVSSTWTLTPARARSFRYGIGPTLVFPTAQDPGFGVKQWGLGPSAILVASPGRFTFGVVLTHLWSFAQGGRPAELNLSALQPFIFYNFAKAWALTSAPLIEALWNAPRGSRVVVPIGLGINRLTRIGEFTWSSNITAYYNVVRPGDAPDWQLRMQNGFVFP